MAGFLLNDTGGYLLNDTGGRFGVGVGVKVPLEPPRYLKQIEGSLAIWGEFDYFGVTFPGLLDIEYAESLDSQGVVLVLTVAEHQLDALEYSPLNDALAVGDEIQAIRDTRYRDTSYGAHIVETIEPEIEGTWRLRLRPVDD